MSSLDKFIGQLVTTFPKRVGLCEPSLTGNELNYLKECIDTGWVSTAGPFVSAFEEKIKQITSCQFAIATNTGTSALHTLYLSAGVQAGDEVLTQSFTFIATVNAISYCGAIPHFVDIADDSSLNICPEKLTRYLSNICQQREGRCYNKKTGRPIKALVVMHTFGRSANLDSLLEVCDKFGLILLEDAAEALGTKYKGGNVGAAGLGGVYSFNGNKITTCGGGGVIVTNDSSLADKARHLSTTAKLPHAYLYDHDQVGYNYRMPNVNAAIGLAQLERLSSVLEQKKKLRLFYQDLFSHLNEVEILSDNEWSESNCWLIIASIKNCKPTEMLQAIKEITDHGVGVRPPWTPIHKLPPYKDCPRADLSATETKQSSLVCLPSSSFLVDRLIKSK